MSKLTNSIILSAMLFSPSVQSGFAATFTWDGSTNLWNSPNWLPGNVAGPTGGNANSAIINSGAVTFAVNDTFGNHATASTVIVTVNSGGTLASGSRFNTIIDLDLNGGTLLANGGVNNPFGAFALKGTVDIGGSAASNINTGGGSFNTVSVGAGGGGGVTIFNVADVTGNANSDFNVNAVLSNLANIASGFTKTGAGTMTLTAANTYTGPTTVAQGTLVFSGGGTTSTASAFTVQNGGVLRFSRNDTWGNHLTVATPVITIDAGGVVESNNTYTSLIGLVLNGGTLSANDGVNANFPAFGLKGTVTANATSGGSFISTSGVGDFNNVTIGNASAGGATTFNVNDGAAAADLTVSTSLSNYGGAASSLTKTGLGTMVLTAANTYSSTTTISAGTLLVNNASGSGLGTSNAFVLAGATLGGTGSFTGTANIATNAILAPGGTGLIESLGTGALTLGNNAIYQWEYQGALADITNVNGALNFGAGLTVLLTSLDGGALLEGTNYTLFTYTGADPVAPEFNLVFGANTPTRGVRVTIDADTNRVLLAVVVPEPATMSLLALAGAAMLRRRRRA